MVAAQRDPGDGSKIRGGSLAGQTPEQRVETLILEAVRAWEHPSLNPKVSDAGIIRETLVASLQSFLTRSHGKIRDPSAQIREFLTFCTVLLGSKAQVEAVQAPTVSPLLCAPLATFCREYAAFILGQTAPLTLPSEPGVAFGQVNPRVGANKELASYLGVRDHPEDVTRAVVSRGLVSGYIGLRPEPKQYLTLTRISPLLIPGVTPRTVFLANVEGLLWKYGTFGIKRRVLAAKRKERFLEYAERLHDFAIAMEGRLPPVPTGLGKVLKTVGESLRRCITSSMVVRQAVNELNAARAQPMTKLSTIRELRSRFGMSTSRTWSSLKSGLTESETAERKKLIKIQEKGWRWGSEQLVVVRARIEGVLLEALRQRGDRLPTIPALIRSTGIPSRVFRREMADVDSSVLKEWRDAMDAQRREIRHDPAQKAKLVEYLREEWGRYVRGEISEVCGMRSLMKEHTCHLQTLRLALDEALSEEERATRDHIVEVQKQSRKRK